MIMETLQREFRKMARYGKRYGRNFLSWNQADSTCTIYPNKTQNSIIYVLGGICLLTSLIIPSILIPGDTPAGMSSTTLISLVVTISAGLFFMGASLIKLANRVGTIKLNLSAKTLAHEKHGVFLEKDIDCITIRRNLYAERRRSYTLDKTPDEELKSVSVGVRLKRRHAFGQLAFGLIDYKKFRDAKTLQKALAEHFNCPADELR